MWWTLFYFMELFLVHSNDLFGIPKHITQLARSLNGHKDITRLTADHRPFTVTPDARLDELIDIIFESLDCCFFFDVVFVNLCTSPNLILAESLKDTSSSHRSEDVVEFIGEDVPTPILRSWHLNLADELRKVLEDLEETLLAFTALFLATVVNGFVVLSFGVCLISAQFKPSGNEPFCHFLTVDQDMEVRVIGIVPRVGYLVTADIRLVLHDTTLLPIYQILLMMIGALQLSESYHRVYSLPFLSQLQLLLLDREEVLHVPLYWGR